LLLPDGFFLARRLIVCLPAALGFIELVACAALIFCLLRALGFA
jgi:hypothetical protein